MKDGDPCSLPDFRNGEASEQEKKFQLVEGQLQSRVQVTLLKDHILFVETRFHSVVQADLKVCMQLNMT